jgi:TonB-linked SusC/RagA family outer membrane protein
MIPIKKSRLLTATLAIMLGAVCALAAPSSVPEPDPALHRVTGNVVDSKGDPLVGAVIMMKGNDKVYAVTDLDGNYAIDVPDADAILVFTFIGFTKTEERVSGRKIINVQLLEENTELADAVVVAYGRQKRESVVASISTVDPENLKVSTSRSISNNLAGSVAGILAIQRSGEPGYDNSTFWIRGISTFQGAGGDPLVLIDGIERDINNIDAEEIESFSVLKDAAASAVYGVRGANGVILINTKRGQIGKPRVTIKAEMAGTAPVKLPQYIGAADYMQLIDDTLVDTGASPMYTQNIARTRANYDPDLYPDVNWIKAVSKDYASNQRVTAEFSGGTDILRYSFVAAAFNEQGILTRDPNKEWDPSIKLQRYNVRSNVDLSITPTTKLRFNIGGYLQDRNSTTQSVSEIFNRAFRHVPFSFPVQYSTGQIAGNEESNVWAMATQMGYQRTSQHKIETLFSLDQDLDFITKGLKANASFSFDRLSSGTVSRSTTPDMYNPASNRNEEGMLMITKKSNGSNTLGHSTSGSFGTKSLYLEASLSYNRTLAQKHALQGLLLANRRNYDNGAKLPYRTQGLAGRVAYTYDSRYVAEFNFGYNGSENFAKGHRYGFFPSVALGWVVTEEPFMAPIKQYVNKLKLRASYGQTGNATLDGRRFAYLSTITDDWDTLKEYRWGEETNYNRNGMAEGEFAVSDLTWEKVNKANLGFELGLFKGAIDLQVDLFDERRNNIFMERESIPATAGFIKMPWQNYGKVKNQGAEISLKVNKQFESGLFLSAIGTFTYAHNTIVEMDEAASVVGTNRAKTGHPVNQLFGYLDDGLYTYEDFVDVENGILRSDLPEVTLVNKVRPGDIKYKDIGGIDGKPDGKIDVYDKTAIGGTVDPELVYGFGLNISYQGLDFGVLFSGVGRTWNILSGNVIPVSNKGVYYNVFTNYEDRWTVDNPSQDVFYPRLDYGTNANNNQASTWWLKDMSFLRLKNLELGYSLPSKITDRIRMSGIRVYVRGTNLLTFSSFKLWDPELKSTTGAAYPAMKSASFGVEFKF